MIAEAIAAEKIIIAKKFWDRLSPTLKEKVAVKLLKVFVSFYPYLGDTHEKNKYVSLLCSRTTPSLLSDVYVETFFTSKGNTDERLSDLAMISDIRDNKRVIIRGNGGSGKTLFLKKLWNDIFSEPKGRIPVFIELRKISNIETPNVKALIRHTLSLHAELSSGMFNEIAGDGTFIFIFDGFDEVALDKRNLLEKELLELEIEYRECGFVVSSRPSETFSGWSRFHIHDVKPFNRNQVLELINKTPIDSSTKSAFVRLHIK